jgi:peptide/nickel transport system substrate-binding protein
MMNRISRAAILPLALFCFGCGGSGTKPLSTDNRVIEWELSDAQSLNPFNYTDATSGYIIDQMYQHLIFLDRQTMQYDIPVLATAMPTVSPDHLQYDFTLRKDIKWPDGQPFTGADVIFSLKALKNPFNTMAGENRVRFTFWKAYFLAIPATFGSALYILPKHIMDPNDFTDKYSWDDIAAIIETAGDKQVDSVMLSKHKNPAMLEYGTWFTDALRNRDPKYIQGSGPYKLDAWATNQYIRLVRNPQYVNHWGPQFEAHPDTLLYKTINDYNAATTALKSHDVDLLGDIQPQYWSQIDTNNTHLKRTAFPLGSFTYIGFNNKSPLFRDPAVRLAMAYMVDRKLIIKKLLFGMAKLTESSIPSTRPEHDSDLPIIPFDPARASHILDSLDWKDHDGDGIRDKVVDGKRIPFKFTFTVNAGNDMRENVCLIIAEALRKIGIDAGVSKLEWSVYLERLRDHLLEAHMGAWITSSYESDEYQLYNSSQAKNRGSNYDNYSDPQVDKLTEDIRLEFDPAKRMVMEKELQKLMYNDNAELFLWEQLNPAAWVDRFDNVSWNSYAPGYNAANWKIRGAAGGMKAEF